MKYFLSCLTISLFLTGCATTKISPEVRQKFNQTQAKIKTTPVATVVDSCLLRSELGTSHIAGQQSRQTAAKFTAELTTQLNEQGVQVTQQLTPFICGYMPLEQLKKYDFKANPDAKREEITKYPVLNSDSVKLSELQNTALLNLNQSLNALSVKNIKNIQL